MGEPVGLRARVPLAPLTTLGVGGEARWFVEVTQVEQLAEACAWASARGVPVTVLAGGSNVVVADAGVDGLVLHVAMRGIGVEPAGEGRVRVRVGAGEPWDPFVEAMVARGLAGLECLSGIPGTVGATPIQNVGAYGQEVARVIASVEVWDRETNQVARLSREACGFGYRTSRFKAADAGRFIVLGVTFVLEPGAPTVTYPDVVAWLSRAADAGPTPTLALVREAVLAIRRGKGMVLDPADPDTRSVGSFFTNPIVPEARLETLGEASGARVPTYPAGPGRVKVPAAWLLEQAGCARGYTGENPEARVGLSTKHTLALVNRGGATAAEVVAFAAHLVRRVDARFGVRLVPEPLFVGFDRSADLDLLRAAHDTTGHD